MSDSVKKIRRNEARFLARVEQRLRPKLKDFAAVPESDAGEKAGGRGAFQPDRGLRPPAIARVK